MTSMPDLDLTPQKSLSGKVSNAIGVVLWIIASLLVRGWLISWGWNRFVTYGLHAEPISVPIALGLSGIVTVVFVSYADIQAEGQNKTPIIEKIVKMMLFYLFSWFIMWVIWQFA